MVSKELEATTACNASKKTLSKAEHCPKNEAEWKIRSSLFQCSSVNQDCVNQSDFQYHCVLNENGTGYIEVCAPSNLIVGK